NRYHDKRENCHRDEDFQQGERLAPRYPATVPFAALLCCVVKHGHHCKGDSGRNNRRVSVESTAFPFITAMFTSNNPFVPKRTVSRVQVCWGYNSPKSPDSTPSYKR